MISYWFWGRGVVISPNYATGYFTHKLFHKETDKYTGIVIVNIELVYFSVLTPVPVYFYVTLNVTVISISKILGSFLDSEPCLCCVCCRASICVMCFPCRHGCCHDCKLRLLNRCLKCDEIIKATINVYVSWRVGTSCSGDPSQDKKVLLLIFSLSILWFHVCLVKTVHQNTLHKWPWLQDHLKSLGFTISLYLCIICYWLIVYHCCTWQFYDWNTADMAININQIYQSISFVFYLLLLNI